MPPSSLAHEAAVAVLSATFLCGNLRRDTLDDVLGFAGSMTGDPLSGGGKDGGSTHDLPSLRAELAAFLSSYDETAPFSELRTLLATALARSPRQTRAGRRSRKWRGGWRRGERTRGRTNTTVRAQPCAMSGGVCPSANRQHKQL